ncbi:HAUS augmin-like complex subunit 6 N-terminus-domain-containing protein [Pseudomassariella vexata]|uniref:HAUS augmin-like complex subunit 6 N-terminus-domain-containing protein n=1 Tax=Pseudomassariella vexata TaxID=1141098 RepID=A0A1Y2DFZ9_9PEZI|nr:HAUS augmin-like complex subunit 6 N-terminus-domain-containing protein [Pseudomassariella vexata]ORY58127.1 HAUS augmin-like complex subunit 6 N-terminus-domain-containing protein [Pseudomassariella vexata]
MSIHQPSTAHTRTRSLRVPPKPALTATATSSQNLVFNGSSTQIPSTTSHVSLFLTNLRLIDLDLDPGWPDITPATFSVKDAAGGQKKRIQCVEWALYHLFELWDAEEAHNKLKPFYPPLDQVQSINLRAALLRGLEHAKRHGVLGRDAVVRKTMLDECKGERLEEVLAVFSSAVLKKLVAERALNAGLEYRPTTSEKIALENWGYSGDRTELNGLILAHKASLSAGLRNKNVARERYRKFEDLLALKERNLAKRQEQTKAADTKGRSAQVPGRTKAEVRQTLKTNWTGNDQWVETLLYDDTGSRRGGLLGTPFDEVWTGVRQGKLSDIEDRSAGLLEQLNRRVHLQRARLEKWEGFSKKLFGRSSYEAADPKKSETKPKGIDLGFTAHLRLQPAPEDRYKFKLRPPPPEYAQLLESMKAALEETGKPKLPDFSNLIAGKAERRSSREFAAPVIAMETMSDLSEWEDEPEEHKKATQQLVTKPAAPNHARGRSTEITRGRSPKKRPVMQLGTRYNSNITDNFPIDLPGEGGCSTATLPTRLSKPQPQAVHQELGRGRSPTAAEAPATPTPNSAESPEYRPLRQPRSKKRTDSDDVPQAPRAISPTQAMADEILAFMSNTSPSPMKKTRHILPLADRTRMSMARTKPFDPDDDDVNSQLLSPSTAKYMKSNTAADVSSTKLGGDDEKDDLVARTRRSMANFEATRQKAQLDRSRSQRKSKAAPTRKESHFSRVEEETTMFGETSVVEELLLDAGQVDMEMVFKSRPKMRTSPAPSPGRRWDDEFREDEIND